MNLANADFTTLEKFLQGAGGFVLGVVFCVFIFVKYVLPRYDRQIAACEKVADSMKDIAIQMQDIVEHIRPGYAWMHSVFADILTGTLFIVGLLGSPVIWFIGYDSDQSHERKVKHAADMVKLNPNAEFTKQAIAEA